MCVKGYSHGPITKHDNSPLNRVIAHIAQASRVARMHFVFRHENRSSCVTIPSGAGAKIAVFTFLYHFCP